MNEMRFLGDREFVKEIIEMCSPSRFVNKIRLVVS